MKNENVYFNEENNFHYKRWEFVPINNDGTKLKLMYYFDGEEPIYEKDIECSLPQFICDFDEKPTDNKIFYNEHNMGLYAVFFTDKLHFASEQSAYDFEFVSPEQPIESIGYKDLYDFIHIRIESYKEDKEGFVNLIRELLKYEDKRHIIKSFIDEYTKNNPKFIYVRIYKSLYARIYKSLYEF